MNKEKSRTSAEVDAGEKGRNPRHLSLGCIELLGQDVDVGAEGVSHAVHDGVAEEGHHHDDPAPASVGGRGELGGQGRDGSGVVLVIVVWDPVAHVITAGLALALAEGKRGQGCKWPGGRGGGCPLLRLFGTARTQLL